MKEILVIDDRPHQTQLIQSLLLQSNAQDFHVETTDQFSATLQRLRQAQFTAILLNLTLADGPPLETFHKVQAAAPHTPIIALVDLQNETLAEAAVQSGAYDYLIIDFLTQPRLICTLRTATEHQRRAVELQAQVVAAQARTESVLNYIADTYILFDREWHYLYVNRAAAQAMDRSIEQILGHTLWELYPDIAGTEVERQYRRSMDERVPVVFDFHYATFDRWWENRFYPVPEGLAVFATNVTDRKRAAAAFRESEEKYRSLFEASLDATFLTTPDGQIFAANPAACRMFGYTEEEFQRLGRGASVDASDPRLAPALEERVRTGHFMGELTFTRKGGAKFAGEIASALFRDKDGQLKSSTVIRDITARKEADTRAAQSTDQLRALSQYLQTAREEERTWIAREIHDELGQALTALNMDLASLSRQIPAEHPHLSQLTAAMSGLVEGIIRTVRSVASQLRPSMLDDLGLAAALEWQAEGFQQRTGIICLLDLPQESPALSRDVTTAVFRIVQEATTNVAVHSKATRLSIGLTIQPGGLHLTIHDNGVGITSDQLNDPHAFGLIGMRERALALGGTLTFESAGGAGTTIRVNIPVADRPAPKEPG